MEKERDENTRIQFKPITQGLGFHLFQDGMPYQPKQPSPTPKKKTQPVGSGALAAGPPEILLPQSPPPFPKHIPESPVTPASPKPTSPTAETATKPEEEYRRFELEHYGWGYLVQRALAFTVDTALNLALVVGGIALALWSLDISPMAIFRPSVILVAGFFFLVFSWSLCTAQEIAFETTVGKRLFGLRIEGPTVGLFLRSFLFLIGTAAAGIGLLWSLFDSKKRCLHDKLTGIQPEEVARL